METNGAMEVAKGAKEKAHIVVFPLFDMAFGRPLRSHLSPLLQLADRLLRHGDFTFTFVFIPGFFPESAIAEAAARPNVNCVTLPPVDESGFPDLANILPGIGRVTRIIEEVLEPVTKLLLEFGPVSAVVVDMFWTAMIDVGKELRVPVYLFSPMPLAVISVLLYLALYEERNAREGKTRKEGRDARELAKFPGNPPFKWTDPFPGFYDDDEEDNNETKWQLHHCRRYREVAGILVNSFDELEPELAKTLLQGSEYGAPVPPVYPIGPLVKTPEASVGSEGEACLRWLDGQPRGAVLYVAFGTLCTLSPEQLLELALGLEASRQRFLWVVRRPHSSLPRPIGDAQMEEGELAAVLPEGFRERTAEVGLVVPEWAPQANILRHAAVGGFLSHCGWNSTLDSVVNGVPLISWPLHWDQKMNGRMQAGVMGISLYVDNEKGVVGRQEIERVVRLLMEGETGEKLRKRAHQLKEAAAKTLSEAGLSHRRLALLVDQWACRRPSHAPAI